MLVLSGSQSQFCSTGARSSIQALYIPSVDGSRSLKYFYTHYHSPHLLPTFSILILFLKQRRGRVCPLLN